LNGVNGSVTFKLRHPISLDNVPDHGLSVTRSRGEVLLVLNEIERGDLTSVSLEGEHKSHVSIVPHLDGLIPGGSDAKGWLFSVVESNAGDGISVSVLFNSMLAIRACVPNLDLVVQSSCDDLSVIWGEINRENIFLVTDELGNGSSVFHSPESDSSIP